MEINIVPVETSNVNVGPLLSELRTMEPGSYSCGKASQNEINKYRNALRAHNYVTKSRQGEQVGERTGSKGESKGKQIPVYEFELIVEVRGAAGEDEPGLPPVKPRNTTKADTPAESNGTTEAPAKQPAKAGR